MRYELLACLMMTLPLISCNKTGNNSERAEFIRVYDSPSSDTALDRDWVSVKGGTFTYYVRSNVEFTAKWQSEDNSWAKITEPRRVEDGLWSIDVTVEPVRKRSLRSVQGVPTGLYSRRYGVLMLSCREQHLGKYLVLEQGFENRINCDFSWLYGSLEPNATFNDVLIEKWTKAQQDVGFTSTVTDGEPNAWLYGKYGYVKLGNDHGAGADLITPHTADFQNDTLIAVSFKAVVQNGDVLPDYTGGTEPIVPMSRVSPRADTSMDDNLLTVEVNGGGYIRDLVKTRGTSMDFELTTYDRKSSSYPGDMFKGASYLVFIEGTDSNPLTVNTSIRFIAGGMSPSGDDEHCSRIFIDDIFVYRLDQLLDEDLFLLNGGKSGKDIITGGEGNE